MKRKRLLLSVLLVVLAGALVYAYLSLPRQERARRSATVEEPVDGGGRREPPAPEGEGLRLELLEEKTGEFPGYTKNIFGSILPPPPPPKPRPAPQPAPAPAPPPEPVQPSRPVVPTAQQALQRELARFTFLGFLEKGGEKSVFLNRDDELFVVKKGSRFGAQDEFSVVELTPEKLVITQQGDAREITVDLVDKAPLVPQFRSSSRTGAGSSSPFGSAPRPGRMPVPGRAEGDGYENPEVPPWEQSDSMEPPSTMPPAGSSPDAGQGDGMPPMMPETPSEVLQ